jgi:hypothetical protein
MGEQRMEENEASDERVCVVCGDTIDIESWHPVLAEPDAMGILRLYPFCTPDCRDAWNENTTDNRE